MKKILVIEGIEHGIEDIHDDFIAKFKDAFIKIINADEDLNNYGYGLCPKYIKCENLDEVLKNEKDELLTNGFDDFLKSLKWFNDNKIEVTDKHGLAPDDVVNPQGTSDWLKDLAEKTIGDVSNGAFICAMIFIGFTICGFEYGNFVWCDITDKSAWSLLKKYDPERIL